MKRSLLFLCLLVGVANAVLRAEQLANLGPIGKDSTFKIDKDGAVYVADLKLVDNTEKTQEEKDQEEERSRRAISNNPPDRFLSNGIPVYHSLPGSLNIIYLDFDGHVNPSDTAWGAFDAIAYDKDGNPSDFSAEAGDIAEIWARVTEDYSAFDVDVTTEPPTTYTDTTAQCVFTSNVQRDGSDMPASSAGGVAYVDVFGQGNMDYYRPALGIQNSIKASAQADVFYSVRRQKPFKHGRGRKPRLALFMVLGQYHIFASEIGHNLGLYHDGDQQNEYLTGFGGQFNDPESWAPIMGVGYYKSLTQWSNGDYHGASNNQDDIEIIKNKFGGFRTDESTSEADASVIVISASETLSGSGVISSRDDVDFWKLELPDDRNVDFIIKPWTISSDTPGNNLDIKASVYDNNGNLISSQDPLGPTSVSFQLSLRQGTYMVQVSSSYGKYYSEYGSQGQYDFEGALSVFDTDRTTTSTASTTPTTTTTTTTTTTIRTCPLDAFEPNNARESPYRVEESVFSAVAVLCDISPDFYEFLLCPGQTLSVSVELEYIFQSTEFLLYENTMLRVNSSRLYTNPSAKFVNARTYPVFVQVGLNTSFDFVRYMINASIDGDDTCQSNPTSSSHTPSTTSETTTVLPTTTDAPCVCSGESELVRKRFWRGVFMLQDTCTTGHRVEYCIEKTSPEAEPLNISLVEKSRSRWQTVAEDQMDTGYGTFFCFSHDLIGQVDSSRKFALQIKSPRWLSYRVYNFDSSPSCNPV